MITLSGAEVVLPDGVRDATLVVEDGRVIDVADRRGTGGGAIDLRGYTVLPGFIDVHIHGLEGLDTLGGAGAIDAIAQRLPKYGVTAFCPTTVACSPQALREVVGSIAILRSSPKPASARVLPAHLESNFINPDYRGAQPAACLRLPPNGSAHATPQADGTGDYDGADVLAEIDRSGDHVGIVTLAPELDGAIDLIRHLVSRGRRVSLGHSGATLEQGRAAIDAGARHATHLFNRMPPINHRDPGLAAAILTSDQVAAEVICDGVHIHHDMVRLAIAAKGTRRMMAITDGVAAAGLPAGGTAMLGERRIRVEHSAAYLEDGVLAGGVATMDGVFQFLVRKVGLSLVDASQLCSTTPAHELGLCDLGAIRPGAWADLVVLDRDLKVTHTYVAGRLVYSAPSGDRSAA